MGAPAIQISSECFFNLIHRNAGVGCWSVCLSDNQFWLSDACFDLLGISENEVPSFDHLLDVMVHIEDRHIITRAAKQFLYRQSGTYKGEVRIKNGEGVYQWFEVSAETRNDPASQEISLYGLLTNIDEKKKQARKSRRS